MSVGLPNGWTTFSGGGQDPSLCGEPQDCPNPPCGEIPPMVITPVPLPGGGHGPNSLSCAVGENSIEVQVTGGLIPFIWATSGGSVTVTGLRTATVDIGNDILGDFDERVGQIAFFKPHMFTNASQVITPHSHCSPAHDPNVYYREATVDVRLRAYDCLKRHITELEDFGETFIDNIQVDDSNAHDLMDNPIGDNSADRGCVLSIDWPFTDTPSPSHPLSDPGHWSVSATGCGLNDPGNVSVHVTASTAGKNAIHGTVHSGAPPYNELKNVVVDQVGNFDIPPTRDTDFPADSYIDVRTQVQVDTNCCVVPTGSDIIVTVIDAQNTVAVIVIPVVEPA
jgi:hypothetical protein